MPDRLMRRRTGRCSSLVIAWQPAGPARELVLDRDEQFVELHGDLDDLLNARLFCVREADLGLQHSAASRATLSIRSVKD